MRIIFLTLTIFGVFHLIDSKKLKCFFSDKVDWGCDCSLYGCFATNLTIEFEQEPYDRYTGNHQKKKNTLDVNYLSIRDSKANYLPRRLDLLFNLTSLFVFNSSLLKIESKDFIGLESLKYLHLGKNYLTDIPTDAFSRLPKLKRISLQGNHIKEILSDVFKNNLQLEQIWLYKNRIKYIGQETFNNLNKLNFVDLTSNRCSSKRYDGILAMKNLKKNIKECENIFEPTSKTIDRLKKRLKESERDHKSLLKISKEPCKSKKNEKYFSEISNVTII